MLVKMPVERLTKGMYVQELDRPWEETDFPFQGFWISSLNELNGLRRQCRYVFVDDFRSRLDERGRETLAIALHRPGKKALGADIEFERWDGEERLLRTLRKLGDLRCTVSDPVHSLFDDIAKKYKISRERVSEISEQIYRALEHEPKIGKWVAALQDRNNTLAVHSRNVAILAMGFARHLGLREHMVMLIGEGALMHDVGMARVPGFVRENTRPLTPTEYNLVKLHPGYAKSCLEAYVHLADEILDIIEFHHYRMDGSGYPERINREIGTHVYIVAICDVYVAMSTYRKYKEPLSPEEALLALDKMSGKAFPSELVRALVSYLGIYPRGNIVTLENGAIGIVVSSQPDSITKPILRLLRGPGGTGEAPDIYLDLSVMDTRLRNEGGWRINGSLHPSKLNLDIASLFTAETIG